MSAIALWRPRRDLLSLGESLGRFFDDWYVGPRTLWAMPTLSSVFPVDVYREDGSLVIKAEVPGVTPDELDITVKDNVLTISGETRAEEEVKEENYVRRERRYGSFSRSLALPVEAEGDKAGAACRGAAARGRQDRSQEQLTWNERRGAPCPPPLFSSSRSQVFDKENEVV